MYELTEKEKQEILLNQKVAYIVRKDGNIGDDGYGRTQIIPTSSVARCWCKMNKGKAIIGDICPECGSSVDRHYATIANKALISKLKLAHEQSGRRSYMIDSAKDQATLSTLFYVRKHPDYDNGIQIIKLSVSVKAGKDFAQDETLVWKLMHFIDIVPNHKCRAYKYVKGVEVDIDPFDAFQLSSKTIDNSPNIYFQDAVGVIDFALKNKTFTKYTGFLECFNLADVMLPRNSFFMFFMYLYVQHPSVELVIKMGYISLIAQIMRQLAGGYNKEYIRGQAKELTKIFNSEATTGSMALTIPRYIADDLNNKDANLAEYIMWSDICEMSASNAISKERYYASTRNNVYPRIKHYGSDFSNILKHGYQMQDIVKYIEKQVASSTEERCIRYTDAYVLFRDYLHMCDMMGVVPDKYPSDIKGAHDNITLAFKMRELEYTNQSIATIAQKLSKYVPDVADGDKYTIIIPKSIGDVVQEGQAMHNCVGSYVSKIAAGKSIVFFIRKADEPNESFITAECVNGHLTQIYYKNNRHVSERDIIDFATKFCNKIARA